MRATTILFAFAFTIICAMATDRVSVIYGPLSSTIFSTNDDQSRECEKCWRPDDPSTIMGGRYSWASELVIKAYTDPEIDENITLVEINARNASHIIRETYCVVTNVDLADNQYFAM